MDTKELEGFRQLLLKQRETVLGASKHNLEAAQEFGKEGVNDVIDDGSNAYNRMVLVSLSEVEKKHIVEIDDALARIKEGTFGTCQSCGQPVGEKRLSVKPEAPLCVKCQNSAEGRG